MKKILALVLAIVMMASMSVVAFAADYSDETSVTVGGTDLTYTTKQGYVITIPSAQTFAKAEGASTYTAGGTVSTSDVAIALSQQLNVFVSSASGDCTIQSVAFTGKTAWTLVDTNKKSNAVTYTAKYGSEKATITEAAILVTKMTEGSTALANGSVDLYFETAGTAQVGNYVDVLTFTATVTEQAA